MNNIIDTRFKKLDYLYHVKGKITREIISGYEYEVSYANNLLIAINYNGLSLNIGDVVDVLVSNTDPTYRVIFFKYVNYKTTNNSIGIQDDNINPDLDEERIIFEFKPVGVMYE